MNSPKQDNEPKRLSRYTNGGIVLGELERFTHVFKHKDMFNDYVRWRSRGSRGTYLALVGLFSAISLHDINSLRDARQDCFQEDDDVCGWPKHQTLTLNVARPIMAIIMTLTYLVKHLSKAPFFSWILLGAHMAHLLLTLSHAEQSLAKLKQDDVIAPIGVYYTVSQHAIISEAFNRVILNVLLSLPSLNLYELHTAWIACTIFTSGYLVSIMVSARLFTHLPIFATFFILLIWHGNRSEFESRKLFLFVRRDEEVEHSTHEIALLELQATSGLSRLYHVLENVLVGIHEVARDCVNFTEETRELIMSEALDGIDFIKQRA